MQTTNETDQQGQVTKKPEGAELIQLSSSETSMESWKKELLESKSIIDECVASSMKLIKDLKEKSDDPFQVLNHTKCTKEIREMLRFKLDAAMKLSNLRKKDNK